MQNPSRKDDAMFRFLSKNSEKLTRRNRCRLGLETLEGREVPAVATVVFTPVNETTDFANTIAAAKVLATRPMLETDVQGSLAVGDVDVFRLELPNTQVLTIGAQARGAVGLAAATPKLTLMNASGQAIATEAAGSGLGVRVSSGTYYVSIANATAEARTSATYTMQVRPIGLTDGNTDPGLLQS